MGSVLTVACWHIAETGAISPGVPGVNTLSGIRPFLITVDLALILLLRAELHLALWMLLLLVLVYLDVKVVDVDVCQGVAPHRFRERDELDAGK